MLVPIHLPDNGEHVLRLDLGLPPAAGTFTPELSLDESPRSNVRYDYGAVLGMTPAGLPPAGTATSWAAPRCQRSSVSGLGSNERQAGLDSTWLIAASNRRSVACQRGRPTWRSSTPSWWRSASTSARSWASPRPRTIRIWIKSRSRS